jgi:protein TonB
MSASLFSQRYQYNERLLWICVVGSMLLHALAVWWFHGVQPAAEAPSLSLRATIRMEAKPAVPPPPPVAMPETRLPEPPAPVAPPEPPKALPKPAVPDKTTPKANEPASKSVPKPAAPQPAAAATPVPAASATAPETKSEAKPEEPKVSTAPPAASSGATDAEFLAVVRGYEQQLAQAAQKYKRYPSEAMEQSWEGTARVKVHIGADGKIAGIEMVSSSGHDMLDEQARITVNKAKPFVLIPAALRGKAFDAEIRVVFTLAKPAE